MSDLKSVNDLLNPMVVLSEELVDGLTHADVKTASKARDIYNSELSWFQLRQKLINYKPEMNMSKSNKAEPTKKMTNVGGKMKFKVKPAKKGGESKMSLAMDWTRKNPKADRKATIVAYQKLGLTKAGSGTYYYLVKKALKK